MELHARGLEELGVRVTPAFDEDSLTIPIPAIASYGRGLRLLGGTLARLRRDPPDVINIDASSAPVFIAARRAGLIQGKVVVMSYGAAERNLGISTARSPQILRVARSAVPPRLTMRFASGIWSVNREDVEYYVATYGVARERAKFIPHAIESSFFEPVAVPRSATQLLFVGTWVPRKGVDVLAAAMTAIARARPDVTLVVAGTLGDEATVRRAMPEVPAHQLRFISRLNDAEIRALYSESTLLLVTSRLEGMPFAMLEAMACGCPTLGAANSGMLDAITEGDNGWLVRTFEPAAWAARALELLAAPEALRAASDRARIRAAAYRLRPLSEETLSWYESLPS